MTYVFFFFQAEDGIRDLYVTGVQTCALPIFITMDDARKKPHPDGLQIILGARDPRTALYVGDNIDDALAARAAGVPFLAILGRDGQRDGARARQFREFGALALLPRVTELAEVLGKS